MMHWCGSPRETCFSRDLSSNNMTTIRILLLVCSVCCFLSPASVRAQDEPRAAWQATNFDITVNNFGAERALNARAVVSLRNVGRGAGSTMSLRINAKAEIKSLSIGGATAAYRSLPEPRGGAQRLTITLPSAIAPDETVIATVEYRLPVAENSGLAAISPVESQFLPLSLWYPTANTPFAVRGADYAPFRLTVTGASAISSGSEKSANGNSIFEQSLNGQPFFVAGTWDRVEGSGNAKDITAFLSKGSGPDDRKQADALIALANDARSFYAGLFGAAPTVSLRLIAVTRGAGFDDAGTVLLGEGAFRRKKIDAVTAVSIAEAVARLWVGAETPVRGEGHGVLREGLARFVAALFIEKQFGPEAAEAERGRQRLAYSAIAKRDVALSRTTQLDGTYFNSVANKGAMVWRLVDHIVGRDTFVAVLRGLLLSAKTDAEGLSLARARTVFVERGGASFKTLLDQQLDESTDMDLMAGLPHLEGGQWVAALRNLASTEVTVNVVATTDTGQRLTVQGTIPGHDFGQATFKSASTIVRVEVDPEKFYPQLDYANDVAPRSVELASSLAEATRLFGAQEYAKAEALARELLAVSPRTQEARIVLARALLAQSALLAQNAALPQNAQLAQNKIDEAEREFRQLAVDRLPTPATLAWSSIGLGEIALRHGQAAEAARNFNDAVHADAEYASTLAARATRIRSEAAANATPAIDESAKGFVNQLDAAIRSGRQAEIAPMIVPGELAGFIRGAVGTQPEAWVTRILRTEQLDSNRLALDVAINSKQLGAEHAGTAVFILARVGAGWKLNAIEFFEVR
jgi:tetratricopeptide (TPR) repeat protein